MLHDFQGQVIKDKKAYNWCSLPLSPFLPLMPKPSKEPMDPVAARWKSLRARERWPRYVGLHGFESFWHQWPRKIDHHLSYNLTTVS